jgi:hypothetical protein
MNENKSLSLPGNFPTHILTIKMGSGDFKKIFLSKEEAKYVAASINSRDQFIVLRESGEAFPKHGAELRKLNKEEIEAIKKNHERASEMVKEEEDIKRQKAEHERAEKWIEDNPEEYANLRERADKELLSESESYRTTLKNRDKQKAISGRAMDIVKQEKLKR